MSELMLILLSASHDRSKHRLAGLQKLFNDFMTTLRRRVSVEHKLNLSGTEKLSLPILSRSFDGVHVPARFAPGQEQKIIDVYARPAFKTIAAELVLGPMHQHVAPLPIQLRCFHRL